MRSGVFTFLCALSLFGFSSCEDPKEEVEIYFTLARNWADKMGGELWHFGELVTRRNTVIESYKRTTIVKEDGDVLLKDMTEKIKNMMTEKVEAVRRIMEVAENKAVMQGDYVEPSFDFYNSKDLINSAPNETVSDQEESENNENEQAQQLKQASADEDYNSSINDDHLDRVQPLRDSKSSDMFDVQQDEDFSESEEKVPQVEQIAKTKDLDITDGSEQDAAQASQTAPEDKRHLPFYPNPHFYNIPVNTNYSSVHVPSNVYERSQNVIVGIKWSEELDNIFKSNYKEDPTLSWQYFGSSTGFMRQFPALIWSTDPTEVDLFDCRMRSWFIEAASSPKDIIILVDRSGSMTGIRREIARHVVNNILDTLGNNDFVNIFPFSNTTDPLIDCFADTLVQANLANVRALKEAMSDFRTEQIANFSLAFTTAFRLLERFREEKLGAQCNQAIMLVTDGVQYNYKDIFKEYNWQNLPFMPVRVFTYLIGREVSDVREVKWMACANQGYYVHLSTISEVREQVLQYIPVMARPMVLNPTVKPNPSWSPVYADVTDPKLTNWLWVNRQQNRQRDRFLLYQHNKTVIITDEHDRKYVRRLRNSYRNSDDMQVYRLMTSVSLPVYDRRPNATRVANLLGVAGTDVPIEYIQRLMTPYRLGVNGYAFIVTNNGYILIHPDLRPVFQGILKPAYNRVDILEIEIMDDDAEARDFNDAILDLRAKIILQMKGHVMLRVKSHLDDFRRIVLGKRHYYYMGINGTPFTVVVTLPDQYGSNRVQFSLDDDVHRMRSNEMIKGPLSQFFTGNWTIHPDWLYCKYPDDKHHFESPEEELLHFLAKIDMPRWKWRECDSKLIKSLVADAKMTDWFNQNISTINSKEENDDELISRFGITVAFLATYSGLTRWQDFPQNLGDNSREELHFHQIHNKAIDEVWYKRAVEQHYIEPRSFVYSVPFEVGDDNNTLVTASHAIFKEDKTGKAPAAVVGFQFYHSALYSFFTKITGSCANLTGCKRTCTSQELYCLVLDNNGYVIVSYNKADTGEFFGHIRPDIMNQLVEEGVYKPNRMYDYQATCFRGSDAGSPATRFITPLDNFLNLSRWFFTSLVYLAKSVLGNIIDEVEQMYDSNDEEMGDSEAVLDESNKLNGKFDRRLLINKTHPESCDHQLWLYTLRNKNVAAEAYNKTMSEDCATRPFTVQPIIGSNLILLIIRTNCLQPTPLQPPLMPDPQEVEYNTSLTCFRVEHDKYPRRNYMSCINRNIHESEIQLCGKGTKLTSVPLIILLSLSTFISIRFA